MWKEENSTDYVPSSWAITKNRYLYPTVKKLQLKALINACKEPSPEIKYKEFEATLKKTVYSIEEAEKYVEIANFTSTLESSEDEISTYIGC